MTPLPPMSRLGPRVEGDVLWLDFHHGRVNEMGRDAVGDLERLADWLSEAPVRLVVSSSRRVSDAGRPLFIAGADVLERVGWSSEETLAHVSWQRAVLERIARLPQLVLAVVGGLAAGWGAEWVLACDYVVATPNATFVLPETGLGIVPGAGGTARLAGRVGLGHALRMGMTGESVPAEEALRIGLVHELVPDLEAGLARARALGERLGRRSPVATAAFKKAVRDLVPLDEAFLREQAAYETCVASGHAAFGRQAFREITRGEAVEWPGIRR